MCFDDDSSPPVPVISGAAVSHERLVLDAANGNRFAAFAALPDEPSDTGIVILPDVRGLYRFYEELALRFAERGYPAIAFDYFGRTASAAKRDGEFEYMPHVQAVKPSEIQADVGAAVAWLREHGRRRSSPSASAWAVATRGCPPREATVWLGAVGFYGRTGEGPDGSPGPIQRSRGWVPILALQAGDGPEHHGRGQRGLRGALRAASTARARHVRAPRTLFDRKQEAFQDASDDAWARVLGFIDAND